MGLRRLSGTVCLAMALPCLGWAQAPVRVVVCPRLEAPDTPSLAALAQALAAESAQSGFVALKDYRDAARRATSFHVAWDDSHLYLLTVCPLDGGPAFRAETHDHDGELWRDDAVEVFLQPAASEVYYHFGWNAAGTAAEERVQDRSWNPRWQLLSEVTDAAWTSLAVIPFACLGTKPDPEVAWRLNVCRSDAANGEFSSWSFSGGGFHRPERFGWLLFTSTPPGKAPALGPGVIAQMRSLFFDLAEVSARRAQIAAVLREDASAGGAGGAVATPRLAGLRGQLGDLEQALGRVEESCATLDTSRLAAFIAQASTVPEVSARAADTLLRWRIERLLNRYEAAGPGRR